MPEIKKTMVISLTEEETKQAIVDYVKTIQGGELNIGDDCKVEISGSYNSSAAWQKLHSFKSVVTVT